MKMIASQNMKMIVSDDCESEGESDVDERVRGEDGCELRSDDEEMDDYDKEFIDEDDYTDN